MRKTIILCACLLSLSATGVEAQTRSVYFWSSAVGSEGLRAGMDSGRPGTWGNGAFEEARNMQYEGAPTLKITTRNFREGVRFDLKTPLDIEPYRKSGYLRLRLHFKDTATAARGEGGGMGRPGGPGGRRPGAGGFGNPQGAGGFDDATMRANNQLGPLPPLGDMGGLPGEGMEPIVTGPPMQQTKLTQLLCTLVLDNGVMEGTIDIPKQWNRSSRVDFDKVHPDANGWLLFVLPLKQMRSTPGAGGVVRRLILSGDHEDSFYLTQSALVVESGKMTVSIRRFSDAPGTPLSEITVKPGPLTLVAEVEAGAADPAIEWNFDADNVGNLPAPNPDGLPEGEQAGGMPGAPGGMPGDAPGGRPRMPALPPAPGAGEGEGEALPVGPRIDARGLVAKFEYPNEEQNYRVEVTVRDRSGKKDPVTASIIVKVRG